MIPQRVMRIVVWFAAAAFLVVLAIRDLQLDRTLEVFADTLRNRATPYVSAFGPPSRVAASSNGVVVVGEPVYVNLRVPRWFRRATVELGYENPGDLPFRFGVRTHPIAWTFQFPDSAPCSTPGVEQKCVRVTFKLQRTWQVERNVYRFVLSAPGASAEQPIVIHALRITAERDPVCIGRLCV